MIWKLAFIQEHMNDKRVSGTGVPHDIWLVVYLDDVNDHENVDDHKYVDGKKDADDHGDVEDNEVVDVDKGFGKHKYIDDLKDINNQYDVNAHDDIMIMYFPS